MRRNGVLLPIFSLPGKYGIGTFSKEAYKFVDKISKAGMAYWQILPLGQTGYGDSPYQSFSTFAGNPYFIDLEQLIKEGLLKKKECDALDFGDNPECIDYEKMYNNRYTILRTAFGRSNHKNTEEYKKFVSENDFWIKDYALFMAIKNSYDGKSYMFWDEDIRLRQEKKLKELRVKYSNEIDFYIFLQYKFMEQWMALKKYANDSGISIIGDIPIYVALDSADTWSEPKNYLFDKDGRPKGVAGTPPDLFSKTGQLWGNPLYDWKYLKSTGYKWWIDRMRHCMKLYDVIRVDHFRAFDEYYFIPYKDKTAIGGRWVKGPGFDLFKTMKSELGEINVVAEDLGTLTDSVLKLVERCGYPGMKVMEFAFDPKHDNPYLLHNHVRNSYAYTGTHDNDTIVGWYRTLDKKTKRFVDDYMGFGEETDEDIAWKFIRAVMSGTAMVSIIPMQDYLALGSEGRINIPSTLGGNWTYRMSEKDFDKKLIDKILYYTKVYKRSEK